MRLTRRKIIRAASAALAIPLGSFVKAQSAKAAATYPDRPIHLIVPFAPGGITDISARLLGTKLGERFGQAVIVENRAGGNQIIGTEYVANSAPDGYTLIMGTMGSHAVNASLRKDLKIDIKNGFAPISLVTVQPLVLLLNPKIKATSVDQLLQLCKTNPSKYTYGSAGVGTTAHMAAELFQIKTGVKLTHVPYKGSSPMLIDLIGGVIDLAFDYAPTAIPQMNSGRLRALAVTSAEKTEFAPDLPPMNKYVPGFQVTAWQGLFAPARTSADVLNLLSREVQQIMKLPDIIPKLREIGAEGVGNKPDEFASFVQDEIELWANVIRTNNIQPE